MNFAFWVRNAIVKWAFSGYNPIVIGQFKSKFLVDMEHLLYISLSFYLVLFFYVQSLKQRRGRND